MCSEGALRIGRPNIRFPAVTDLKSDPNDTGATRDRYARGEIYSGVLQAQKHLEKNGLHSAPISRHNGQHGISGGEHRHRHRDMDCFRSRLTDAERRVGEVEDALQNQGVSLRTVQTKMKVLEARAEDAENRNRRNNLRIVGLPEGTEGKDPTAFTEHLLRTLLPDARFSDVFVVERAHRMPATRVPPGTPPRTFILKLLNFRDRDQVLREARKIEVLHHEGAKLMIFLDFSIDTQRLRRFRSNQTGSPQSQDQV